MARTWRSRSPPDRRGTTRCEQDGLPVFVSRGIAEPLEDAVLDIETTDTGVSLVIKMDDEADEMVDTGHDAETPKTSPERLN